MAARSAVKKAAPTVGHLVVPKAVWMVANLVAPKAGSTVDCSAVHWDSKLAALWVELSAESLAESLAACLVVQMVVPRAAWTVDSLVPEMAESSAANLAE